MAEKIYNLDDKIKPKNDQDILFGFIGSVVKIGTFGVWCQFGHLIDPVYFHSNWIKIT